MSARVLAIIPARGGSKGVPGKNLRLLAGKPLIVWTIEAARQAESVTDIVVSTDSAAIRDVAVKAGAQAPFVRPEEMASDQAPVIPALQHAVSQMESRAGVAYDVVVMLQPTSPMRLPSDVDNAVQKLLQSDADGVISVRRVDNDHPMKMKRFNGTDGLSGDLIDYEKPPYENPPRQILPPVFMVNGAVYATRRDVLMERGSLQGDHCIGYVMEADRSVNIDDETDFVVAELRMTVATTSATKAAQRSNAGLRDLYEQVYSSGKERWFTYPTFDCTEEVVAALDWQGKTVLEVGCGTGDTAAAVARAGARVTAIDYAEAAIAQARETHADAGVDFRAATADDVAGSFDVVVLQETLEHSDDPSKTLDYLAGRLHPGGRIVITCPAFMNPRGYVWMTLQTLLDVPMSLSDIHFVSPFDVAEWAADAGLTLERWHSFRHWQAWGEGMAIDMEKRLLNALRDAGLPNDRVRKLVDWLLKASEYEQPLRHNGAKIIYLLKRNP